MNATIAGGVELARQIGSIVGEIESVDVVICPPFVSLSSVAHCVSGSNVTLGAQDVSEHDYGAYTGEVATGMLAGIVDYVIIGHSERRSIFGESDARIARKVAAVIAGGMTPILCVGESEDVREVGRAERFVRDQVKSCLSDYERGEPLVIAYEPVWAIGTGLAATVAQIEYMIESIREELADLYSQGLSERTRILYGGSVNPSNVDDYAASDSIDGALVGGASLNGDDFAAIVASYAVTASRRSESR